MTNAAQQNINTRFKDLAVQLLVTDLIATENKRNDFPELSKAARLALARLIVERNGYKDYDKNTNDAINEIQINRGTWEYYGLAGWFRRIIRKATG